MTDMQTTSSSSAALAAFDRARSAFQQSVEDVPEAALQYRPEGEDYALGGLAVHVAQVLEKYARVLAVMRTSTSGPVSEPEGLVEPDQDKALIHDGYGNAQRAQVVRRVAAAHAQVTEAIRALPTASFDTKVPVIFAGSTEPYPASPADILGWVHAHYDEHIAQIADLRKRWETVR